jgi:DNA repair exonuclease SbcCD ATPase subunit
LLQQREQALAALQQKIDEAERAHQQIEAERRHQAIQLDGAVNAVDEAESRLQVKLDADPAYRAAREAAEAAERRAMHAQEKADRSAAELSDKGEDYRGDPLFMYLWERRYGMPAYRASGLFRWLDGKVARLIGFADARANFSRLNDIPKRLQEHADHLAAEADSAFDVLKALDDEARAADGIPALEAHVADEQRQLDDVDERIQAREAEHQALLTTRAEFAVGEDEYTRNAIDYLATEFGRADVADLYRLALATPYPEDDVIVSRMRRLGSELDGQRATLADLRGLLEKHRARLRELEDLRLQFKRNRYDRAGSVFSNDSMLPVLLGQFLAGMLDSKMLWKVLQEHQRYRPRRSNPDFGSGGFGRGTVWRGGLGDIGDVIGGLGRGGFGGGIGGRRGGGGGGFRTGGGF